MVVVVPTPWADAERITRADRTVEFEFRGPQTGERQTPNPFTDYRLIVTFTPIGDNDPIGENDNAHTVTPVSVRGFYAADGDAANSGATRGNVWKCRFTPTEPGRYRYTAELVTGKWVAVEDDATTDVTNVPIDPAEGWFRVVTTDDGDPSMHRIKSAGHYFTRGGKPWMKRGTNSPENLLAYADFDGTRRIGAKIRDGESDPGDGLHRYEPHRRDFRDGDPTWQNAGGPIRGRGLIGMVNYVADVGFNSMYFLTLNIGGDGKDVWPYADPEDVTRMDCGKLDQWEIVFEHMQSRGVAMHVITQETENELLLDDGDLGRHRRLYYNELIARFAHHPGWVWNIGEETGAAEWKTRKGLSSSTTDQHRAIADYLKSHDPYDNVVLIHTHADSAGQTEVLTPLIGHPTIDGLSLQVHHPRNVHHDVKTWRQRSADSGHPWIVSMDEIGPAKTGAPTDAMAPSQDQMRRRVLWGSIMAGAAGVEWYFGYETPHNDLNTEDLRSRETLFKQTTIAGEILRSSEAWPGEPVDDMILNSDRVAGHAIRGGNDVYVLYRPAGVRSEDFTIRTGVASAFEVFWYDPRVGGEPARSHLHAFESTGRVNLGPPPSLRSEDRTAEDWIVVLKPVRR